MADLNDDLSVFDEENNDPPFDPDTFEEEGEFEQVESKISSPDEDIIFDLGKDKFSALLSIFKIMKPTCQDMIIKSGKIIQMTTKKHFIFSIDLSPIVGEIDLIIPSIAQRLQILELFKKQNVDMFLDVHSKGYRFRDSRSGLNYRKALESFSEKSLTMDEALAKLLPDTDKEIFSLTWDKMLLERMSVMSQTLGIPVLNIEFKGDTADILFRPIETMSAETFDITKISDELDDTSLVDMSVPFPIEPWTSMLEGGVEEIESVLYHRKTTTPSACLMLKGELPIGGTDLTIKIEILTGSVFSIKEEERKSFEKEQ